MPAEGFGTRLREVLDTIAMTQRALSRRSGVQYHHLSAIINNKKFPTLITAVRIGQALPAWVDFAWLVDGVRGPDREGAPV